MLKVDDFQSAKSINIDFIIYSSVDKNHFKSQTRGTKNKDIEY